MSTFIRDTLYVTIIMDEYVIQDLARLFLVKPTHRFHGHQFKTGGSVTGDHALRYLSYKSWHSLLAQSVIKPKMNPGTGCQDTRCSASHNHLQRGFRLLPRRSWVHIPTPQSCHSCLSRAERAKGLSCLCTVIKQALFLEAEQNAAMLIYQS